MIEITTEHNEFRLGGTLALLDRGTGNAAARIYGGTRPPSVNDVPGSVMLVQVSLTKPGGTIADGELLLTQLEDGLIGNTGMATWARFVDGNGVTAFDCDAGEGVGAWEVQLAQTSLFAGGAARIVTARLG